MSVEIKITNPEEVEKKLVELAGGVREVASEASEDMVFAADRLAKDHARSKSRKPNLITGRYFGSIHPVIGRRGRFVLTGAIASNVNYAGFLEFGTRPHVIVPKTKKALFWPGADHPVKKVNHPGTPGFRVLGGAAEDVVKRAEEFVGRAMKRKFTK